MVWVWNDTIFSVLAPNGADADKIEEAHKPLVQSVRDREKIVRSLLRNGHADVSLDEPLSALTKFMQIDDQIVTLAKEAGTARATDISSGSATLKLRADLSERVSELVAYVKRNLAEDQAGAVADYQQARTLLVCIILVAILVALGAGAWISISIGKGLGQAVGLADAVAAGDLGRSIEMKADDEIGDLVTALNRMVDNLKGTVKVAESIASGDLSVRPKILSDDDTLGRALDRMVANLGATADVADSIASGDLTVQAKPLSEKDRLGIALERMLEKLRQIVTEAMGAADNVASGSQELSASAEQLSQGATEQASAAEEASSSMEEMASNIKQNADNASQTEKIARQSSHRFAQTSGEAVTRAVTCDADNCRRRSPSCRRSPARPTCWR